jgi:hypothetical protein
LVKCFISIGTGNPGKKPFEDSMAKFLSHTIVEIATETENTEKKFIAKWAKHLDEKRYYRFNVEQGLQNIGLDEYKKKGAIEAATEGYLTHSTKVSGTRLYPELETQAECVHREFRIEIKDSLANRYRLYRDIFCCRCECKSVLRYRSTLCLNRTGIYLTLYPAAAR